MNDNLVVFENKEFGKLTVINKDGNPWWVASEICKILGHTNTSQALKDNCKYPKILRPKESLGLGLNPRGVNIIPESDLYRLIIKSKLPAAEAFEKWVMEEVLPSIRKTGGYIVDRPEDTPEEIMARALVVAQDTLRRKEERINQLEQKAEEDRPLIQFANQVASASDSIDAATFAKIVYDEHIKIGRNKLFEWFRDKGYLQKNNLPYQSYIDGGLFTVIEQTYKTPYGTKLSTKTLITPKGQIYFVRKLKDEFGE